MRGAHVAIVVAILLAGGVAAFLLFFRAPSEEGPVPVATSASAAAPSSAPAPIVTPPPAVVMSAPPPPVASSAPKVASNDVDMTTAQRTVETQIMLLKAGRDADFRATFLFTVSVDAEGIAACKKRVEQVPVRPDWEMAESATDPEGNPVRRVSIFGKSMTGFHKIGNQWLADRMWCIPTGLP